jgi:hypothetical protein
MYTVLFTTSGAGSPEYHEPSAKIGLPFDVKVTGSEPSISTACVILAARATVIPISDLIPILSFHALKRDKCMNNVGSCHCEDI